ncbi:MAG: amidohydrolase [Marinilabiliales bacterium]|nr:MAG: amidohydrolase [Marinilabiliales bacterium]
MSKLKIAVLQYDIIWENALANQKKITDLINNAENADVYVLPEMFNTGFSNNVSDFAEEYNGATVLFMKNLAKSKNTAICGSIILSDKEKYYNSFLFVKPDGDIIRYDKRHLFKMGGEADMFTSGKNRVVYSYKGVRFLLQVCYDLRFPVWSRNRNDYDVIIYIANWPASRRYIYDTLLSARAIENQAYVIAANRIGEDGNGIKYDGGTSVFDFKGTKICNASDNIESFIYSDLHITDLKDFRDKFPAWQDADDFDIKL